MCKKLIAMAKLFKQMEKKGFITGLSLDKIILTDEFHKGHGSVKIWEGTYCELWYLVEKNCFVTCNCDLSHLVEASAIESNINLLLKHYMEEI
jgi:hypothetical protein